jgi:para-aminobenzoate synthetase component 1
VEAFAAAFPGGSVTGAPKVRAMDVIEELEEARRGPYCGSLLLADGAGRLDSSITIRTLLHTDGRLLCWGGGGIVADSDPDAEWEEIRHKVGSLVCGA